MNPRGRVGEVFRLESYDDRRGRRFRCGICARLVETGEDVVVERVSAKRARGYHVTCFSPSDNITSFAAVERHVQKFGTLPVDVGWTEEDLEREREAYDYYR